MVAGMKKVLQKSCILSYELVVISEVAVEYIQVDGTGVNTYSIRIKL